MKGELMKKFALTGFAFAAGLGLAACSPAEEAPEAAPEPEAMEAMEPAAEEAVDGEAVMEAGEEATGGLDPDGNPVDQ